MEDYIVTQHNYAFLKSYRLAGSKKNQSTGVKNIILSLQNINKVKNYTCHRRKTFAHLRIKTRVDSTVSQ